ncbi:MAG: HlyD family efflux transporter periplasmic adaptor subunit [Burkholderiaceae bacterium]|nr:HlyD family efflux transporter periplasmic adaptor subunit [Burkholderiaceae bacterium]MDH3459647.1 HlyD family efflux transporter periplasmic adaptor subunit [Burkholderiaceae bacterium]
MATLTCCPRYCPVAGGLALLLLVTAACSPQPPATWSGYAEGEYVYVAAALAGTLNRLLVHRGEEVQANSPLFALEAQNEQAGREEAAARLAASRAQATNLAKGRRSDELAVIQAQFAQAQAQAQWATSELSRLDALRAQGFVSTARLDQARSDMLQASSRVDELKAALRVAGLPARNDEQAAAAAEVRAARQALRQFTWREEQKSRSAPAQARVAETYFRIGEWVNAGQPVLSLLPRGSVKARFFVPQAEIADLALGQAVQLRCDGCGAPIAARVSFIATQAEYTPPVIYSNSQRAKLVFMVEAQPSATDAERLRPGQPLDVQRVGGAAP